MTATNIFEWLSNQSWAQAISGSMAFGILECLHVVGMAMLFGSVAILDLRLLGFCGRDQSVRALAHATLRWTWLGFVLAMITGFLLFAGAADRYAQNRAFQFKLAALALAGVNMALFHLSAWRRVSTWDVGVPTPPAAVIAGALSVLLWICVVAAGRWIAFA